MKYLMKHLKNGLTVTREVSVKITTNEEDKVYSALFVAPADSSYDNSDSQFYSDIDLEDLMSNTSLTEQEILKSLKSLIKKKLIEYYDGEIIMHLIPNFK